VSLAALQNAFLFQCLQCFLHRSQTVRRYTSDLYLWRDLFASLPKTVGDSSAQDFTQLSVLGQFRRMRKLIFAIKISLHRIFRPFIAEPAPLYPNNVPLFLSHGEVLPTEYHAESAGFHHQSLPSDCSSKIR
jgi:hypothetical protein